MRARVEPQDTAQERPEEPKAVLLFSASPPKHPCGRLQALLVQLTFLGDCPGLSTLQNLSSAGNSLEGNSSPFLAPDQAGEIAAGVLRHTSEDALVCPQDREAGI